MYTDNNPLSHFQSIKLGATEQRWVAQLAEFDFTVQYRPGHNGNADSPSRQYSVLARECCDDISDPSDESIPDVTQNVEADVATLQQIGVFPSRSRVDLVALQGADPLLKSFF